MKLACVFLLVAGMGMGQTTPKCDPSKDLERGYSDGATVHTFSCNKITHRWVEDGVVLDVVGPSVPNPKPCKMPDFSGWTLKGVYLHEDDCTIDGTFREPKPEPRDDKGPIIVGDLGPIERFSTQFKDIAIDAPKPGPWDVPAIKVTEEVEDWSAYMAPNYRWQNCHNEPLVDADGTKLSMQIGVCDPPKKLTVTRWTCTDLTRILQHDEQPEPKTKYWCHKPQTE